MKKGVKNVVILYSVGTVSTVLTYFILGATAGHGPGPYIIIPFLTFLIGLFWTGSTLFNYFNKNKTAERKGVIYSNIVVIVIVVGTILYLRSQIDYSEMSDLKREELTTQRSGDTTLLMYNDTVIYLTVKDSVHVDKRDSLINTFK